MSNSSLKKSQIIFLRNLENISQHDFSTLYFNDKLNNILRYKILGLIQTLNKI